jgi:hypothetical protein
MSGLASTTTYAYRLDLRSVTTGQTGVLFQFPKTTDAFGDATTNNRADITSGSFEVKANMDAHSSDWVLVSC